MRESIAIPTPYFFDERRPDGVGVAQIGRALRRRFAWIILPAMLAFGASAVFVNSVTPLYTGEAKLILEARDSFYTRPTQDRNDPIPQIDEQAVASQVQVVMSRDLAREAIKRLGLIGNPEFDPARGSISIARQYLAQLGLTTDPLERPAEERLLENYYERLLVYPVGKSRILAVEFRSRDPELAARAANTIAEMYIAMQESAKKDNARSASTWLGANVEGLRARVAEAEAKVEAFRARTGLLLGGNNAPIAGQQLSDLNTQLAQARNTQADAQAKAALIRESIENGRTFEIPDVANNELIRRLIEQRINLRAQLALEQRTLLPRHPRIKELQAQLEDLEGQVRGSVDRVVRTLENEARIAGSRVESVQSTIDAQKKIVVQAGESEVELRALEREARASREQLEAYLARYREAMARDAENATPADARIISRAVVAAMPSFPKKLPVVALATLATVILALGAIVAAELLKAEGAPRSGAGEGAWAASSAFGLGAGSAGGALDAAPQSYQPSANPAWAREPLLEAAAAGRADRFDFAALIARLSAGAASGRGRRVLITGIGRSEEALIMAVDLAHRLALESRAIFVIVDPSASAVAGAQPGFTDVVAGKASVADTIKREPASNLHVISAGLSAGRVLAHEPQGLGITLSALQQTYDWVICGLYDSDDPALLSGLAAQVDAVVIASDADPASTSLVDLYERARAAGPADVMVARELAPAGATA